MCLSKYLQGEGAEIFKIYHGLTISTVFKANSVNIFLGIFPWKPARRQRPKKQEAIKRYT